MSETHWYVIPDINPVPWTAPTVSVGRKNGKPYPQVYSSAELKNYKAALAEAVLDIYGDVEIIEDEIALRFFFWRKLDKLERGTKRKGRGRVADATNLQKATEDALQGILFKNDIQVARIESCIMAQHDAVSPCIAIELTWHPVRPVLPAEIQAQVDVLEHGNFGTSTDNEHEVPVEEWF